MRVHDVADAAPIGAGLNPAHVDVVDLDVGEAPAELFVDRGIGRPRHLDLGDARLHGLQRGIAADFADPNSLTDEGNLLLRLDQTLAHGVVGHVGELEAAEGAIDHRLECDGDRIFLVAETAARDPVIAQHLAEEPHIVFERAHLPVVEEADVLVVAAVLGPDILDEGDDQRGLAVPRDHGGVQPAEGRAEEAGVVEDVVKAGQDHGIERALVHQVAACVQIAQATLHLADGPNLLRGDPLCVGHGASLHIAVVLRNGSRHSTRWQRPPIAPSD